MDKGYYDPDLVCDIQDQESSMLDQPHFPKGEVLGLAKTFGLYQVVPKPEWKWVEKAEKNTKEGHDIFNKLTKEYLHGGVSHEDIMPVG